LLLRGRFFHATAFLLHIPGTVYCHPLLKSSTQERRRRPNLGTYIQSYLSLTKCRRIHDISTRPAGPMIYPLELSATSGKAGGLREVERPKAAWPSGRSLLAPRLRDAFRSPPVYVSKPEQLSHVAPSQTLSQTSPRHSEPTPNTCILLMACHRCQNDSRNCQTSGVLRQSRRVSYWTKRPSERGRPSGSRGSFIGADSTKRPSRNILLIDSAQI
jgi:hypothetical protein